MQTKKVIIVGGGFGGIRTALDLAKNKSCQVTLISQNKNFEYYPGIHKILGVSHHVTCEIPLETIFKHTSVQVAIDKVTSCDPKEKKVTTVGHGVLTADYLVLAMGSQTEFFNIEGLNEMAFGFKSVAEAKKIRHHIEEMFQKHGKTEKAESVVGLHMTIVGGGPNGVDLAGELAVLSNQLARKYGVVESLVTIDIIEAGSRVLGMMPESVSIQVEKRLRALGVTLLLNRELEKQGSWTIVLKDMTLGSKTLVWTAGVCANGLVKNISGLELGKRDRVIVDEYLQAKDFPHVFAIGDIAETQYTGLAQTALYDGAYVAKTISRAINSKPFNSYIPKAVAYNIGVGPRWSVLIVGKFITYGFFAYVMRTLIDIKFFLSILPVKEVWNLYFSKHSK